MSYHEPDYYSYYEPSIADGLLAEYQEKMKEALLDSIKFEIDNIKTENERLKEENKKLKDEQKSVKNKARELEHQKSDLMRQVKKERLSKLMEDFQVVMYKAHNTREKLPKCDKCNENRKIKFKSPSKKIMYEDCSCNIDKIVYVPEEHVATEFRISQDNSKMLMWYKLHHEKDHDWYNYESNNLAKIIYRDGMSYTDLKAFHTYFKSEEECQKYCDWLNNK